jgi:hypothetical protein
MINSLCLTRLTGLIRAMRCCRLCLGLSFILFGQVRVLVGDSVEFVPPAQPIPASFFCMHIHRLGAPTPWPSVPIGGWRLWDAHVAWPDLEPRKGQWRFDNLDRYLSAAEEHHVEVLLPLGLSPHWASSRPDERSSYGPGFAAEPADLEDWRTYVTTVVTHCGARVSAYEIWNEPNLKSFWSGDTERLVLLTREASRIIRSINPRAIIVSPSATAGYGTKWLAEFLGKGGGQYADVIGYHLYVNPDPPEAMLPMIQQIKQIMADNGAGDKPLWNTELGWSKPKPFLSEELAAAFLARSYILNWAAGVQRIYWYAWDNHNWVTLQTVEEDNQTLKPAGLAYGIVQKWLVGARIDRCNEDADHTWKCQLTQNGSPQWIVWNPETEKPFAVPASWLAKSITPLHGQPQALSTSSVEIGPTPELLTQSLPQP